MNIRAVIFDISGTVLDFGSRAPVRAFVETFREAGVEISEAEARGPMGLDKRDHLAALLARPEIAGRWRNRYGEAPGEAGLDRLYAAFTPRQMAVIPAHADVLPGVPGVTAWLRERGVKFANTTGFSRAMLRELIPLAAAGGYQPDAWVCPDDVGGGRPAPWMIFEAARRLGLYPLSQFVKVGDTAADIAEARAAGTWSVSVVEHGNEVGLARADWEALALADQEALRRQARARLEPHRPHYILDRTADLPGAMAEISARLARGERP